MKQHSTRKHEMGPISGGLGDAAMVAAPRSSAALYPGLFSAFPSENGSLVRWSIADSLEGYFEGRLIGNFKYVRGIGRCVAMSIELPKS